MPGRRRQRAAGFAKQGGTIKLLHIWASRDAWTRLAKLKKRPAIAMKTLKYAFKVHHELATIEQVRSDLVKAAVADTVQPPGPITLDPDSPEGKHFISDFSAFLSDEADLPPCSLFLEDLVESLADEPGNEISDSDLKLLQPLFMAKPA